MRIKEVIVVEGKDDQSAVKAAVDAEIITTSGFGMTRETFERIKLAREQKGVIILTDPDHAGEQIRRRINTAVKGCKNAYLCRDEARRKDNIGVENASPHTIREALEQARCIREDLSREFTMDDMMRNGLVGVKSSSERRKHLGRTLRIGYANGKQFLARLNNYSIDRELFESAVSELGEAHR